VFLLNPKKSEKKLKEWNIKAIKVLKYVAVLGRDTTSHLYVIGKGTSTDKEN